MRLPTMSHSLPVLQLPAAHAEWRSMGQLSTTGRPQKCEHSGLRAQKCGRYSPHCAHVSSAALNASFKSSSWTGVVEVISSRRSAPIADSQTLYSRCVASNISMQRRCLLLCFIDFSWINLSNLGSHCSWMHGDDLGAIACPTGNAGVIVGIARVPKDCSRRHLPWAPPHGDCR